MRVYRAAAPTIDGNITDPCWSAAISVHPFLNWPDLLPAVHQSFLMLSYDDDHLYVALRCLSPDTELLRAADGDLTLNDRVELTLSWAEGSEHVVIVDAAGRVKSSPALRGVKAAAQRHSTVYTVEIAVPRPAKARLCRFFVRRYNEVLGEVSSWGTRDDMAEARLTARQGPIIKISDVPRYPASGKPIKLRVANPTEGYITVRCRVTIEEYATSMPHLVRLTGGQAVQMSLSYNSKDVAKKGFRLVVDEPSGREIYLRAPPIRPPIGKGPRSAVIAVVPHPQNVTLNPEAEPYAINHRTRIYVGSTSNAAEMRAAELVQGKIRERCGYVLRIKRAGLFTSFSNAITIATRRTSKSLMKRVGKKIGLNVPDAHPDQSYVLAVTSGKIAILAHEEMGTMYGAQTLLQILDAASTIENTLVVPWMQIVDWPAFDLRGCVWRGARLDHPAIYTALARLKLNLLTTASGPNANTAAAQAHGIFLASWPTVSSAGGDSKAPVIKMTPSESMPRSLRRSLRLPIALVGTGARPSDTAFFATAAGDEPVKRVVEVHRGPLMRDDAVPVSIAWPRAEPWPLLHASRWGAGRETVVGLCGELPEEPLLPPSWAKVAAAAEYGWSSLRPQPSKHRNRFYKVFYGTLDLRDARRLLEHAVASLPRRTALADLLDPARPEPAAPRADIADLIARAKAKAARATRNKELAGLLASSGNRVLAAARNVTTAIRLRRLFREALALESKGQRDEAAKRLSAVAEELTAARGKIIEHLGPASARSADVKLHVTAAAAATKLATHYASGAKLPSPAIFWATLRGERP